MPKGLKETSSLIAISAKVTETAANTFTSQRVDLQLNPLDNEVFIVYAIDLDASRSIAYTMNTSLSSGFNCRSTLCEVNVFAAVSVTFALIAINEEVSFNPLGIDGTSHVMSINYTNTKT